MIDFEAAIAIALLNLIKLIPGADDITLEGAVISPGMDLYEIIYSYNLEFPRGAPVSMSSTMSNIELFANLAGRRRRSKIFLVDFETGEFRGFRTCNEG